MLYMFIITIYSVNAKRVDALPVDDVASFTCPPSPYVPLIPDAIQADNDVHDIKCTTKTFAKQRNKALKSKK